MQIVFCATYDTYIFYRTTYYQTSSYSGEGEAKFKSGNTYKGGFCRGVMDGRGRYNWVADGTIYEGDIRWVPGDSPADVAHVLVHVHVGYLVDCLTQWKRNG